MSLKQSKYLRLLFVASLLVILAFGLARPASAAEFRGGNTVTIGSDEVVDDDLIVSANTVVVDGVIHGDLIVTGVKVTVNGRVNGSLVFAGQVLTLNGQIGGAVYSAGATLRVGSGATVERNLFFAGYSYKSEAGSIIGRDTMIAGYQAVLDGEVKRDLNIAVAALELNGKVNGNVQADVESPGGVADAQFWTYIVAQDLPPALAPGLRVGPEAIIGGSFRYISPVDQASSIAARPEGGVFYSMPRPATGTTAAVSTPATAASNLLGWFWPRLREFVTLFLLGALALWLTPVIFNRIGERTQSQALLAAAWGLLVAMVGYSGALLVVMLLILVVAGLGALTLSGLAATTFAAGFSSLWLAFTLFSLLVAYGSKLVVLYPLSHMLLEKYLPQWNHYKIVPLIIGVGVFVLLRSIPILGLLLSFGVTLVGLGAMWLVFRDRFTQRAVPQLVLTPA
jgi:hypothetical protein